MEPFCVLGFSLLISLRIRVPLSPLRDLNHRCSTRLVSSPASTQVLLSEGLASESGFSCCVLILTHLFIVLIENLLDSRWSSRVLLLLICLQLPHYSNLLIQIWDSLPLACPSL